MSTPDSMELFFTQTDLDRRRVQSLVGGALKDCDDGELFLEYSQSEGFSFDDGRLKNASFDTSHGFGMRAVANEATAYAHASELSEPALERAAQSVQAVKAGHSGTLASGPARTNVHLYDETNPLDQVDFESKVALLKEIDAYARAKDERVRQVSCSLSGEWQVVEIIRPDGDTVRDVRPLVRLDVSVVVGKGNRQESGREGAGGRTGYEAYLEAERWQSMTDEALRQALVNLESVPAPAGEMTVVLGPGWPGILLHEAIGHGLEGDFNRKKTSAFAGLMGERIASEDITVVDDGTIPNRRGSLSIDDEGTPTAKTTLIDDGILVGYMQDRMNARLMDMAPTGNGRREAYNCPPLPRMTNTYMMAGRHDPEEILQSCKNGLYAVSFGGGQVDITSGKFVFSCTEAYLVKDGRAGESVRGATLIGDGPDVLTKVSMVGNDLELDPGVGTCGKAGQGVPVGVGQPTLLIDGLTVGGTQT